MPEIIIIILAPIILYLILCYQTKKRDAKKLSDRLYNLENDMIKLKNKRY